MTLARVRPATCVSPSEFARASSPGFMRSCCGITTSGEASSGTSLGSTAPWSRRQEGGRNGAEPDGPGETRRETARSQRWSRRSSCCADHGGQRARQVDGCRGARRRRNACAARTATPGEPVPGQGIRLCRRRSSRSHSWDHPAHPTSRRTTACRVCARQTQTLGRRAQEQLAQPVSRAAHSLGTNCGALPRNGSTGVRPHRISAGSRVLGGALRETAMIGAKLDQIPCHPHRS